jgi:hypothetical protein
MRHPTDTQLVLHCLDAIRDRWESMLVMRHISGCDRCLAEIVRLRAGLGAARTVAAAAATTEDNRSHLSSDDLERHYLGTVQEPELTTVEEHLLICKHCIARAEEAQDYVDAIRAAMVAGGLDRQAKG